MASTKTIPAQHPGNNETRPPRKDRARPFLSHLRQNPPSQARREEIWVSRTAGYGGISVEQHFDKKVFISHVHSPVFPEDTAPTDVE